MNAFEDIVAYYFEEEGYWVRKAVKVNISKEEKKFIGLPSMPRPEIDLVALKVKENTLLLIEAKSYLDSPGVRFNDLNGENQDAAKRYRLFTDVRFREIVTRKMQEDYLDKGLINIHTRINYALAAGNVYSNDEARIQDYFQKNGWIFISPSQIKGKIKKLADKGWEDNLITITTKLILKN
ncbi:MAG: hypothetical protein PWQ98_473 [Moorella sp. (in: firmicutes)]|jgi:hypothetical protein|nr:hypothetical protein [Moorella sp. (in: firmicutes)]